MKNAAVNTGVHVSTWVMVFSGYTLSSGIAEPHGSFSFGVFFNLAAPCSHVGS